MNSIELLSTTEAAQLLNVTSKTILHMIHDGRLKAIKLGKATSPWKINKQSVIRYLKQVDIGATAKSPNTKRSRYKWLGNLVLQISIAEEPAFLPHNLAKINRRIFANSASRKAA